jgi:predicted ATPase
MPGSRLSQTEQRLKSWWDNGAAGPPFPALKSIAISGTPGLRGITGLTINFPFPVTVICGRNGTGKSTILALAALGFQPPNGHLPLAAIERKSGKKKSAHYTFGDFFFKGPSDPNISGVTIKWEFSGATPAKEITKQSDKWMRYETRPERPMHFVGLSRVMPPIEQRALRGHFKAGISNHQRHPLSDGMRSRLQEIIGKPYSEAASFLSSRNTRIRTCNAGIAYSGFNMGSGEDIVIGLLSLIEASPAGSLIVIEEIEVGLFPKAQEKLMEHLLELSWEKKLQFVISTHSDRILDRVPRLARILIQPGINGVHSVSYSPTTRFASSSMVGNSQSEAIVFCEDAFAATMCRGMLSLETAGRCEVTTIGSCSEIARATAYATKANSHSKLILGWDGDVTDADIRNWVGEARCREVFSQSTIQNRTFPLRLPGNTPPERFVVQSLKGSPNGVSTLANELNCLEATAVNILEQCLSVSNVHDIPRRFSELSNSASDEEAARRLCKAFALAESSVASAFNEKISRILDGAGEGDFSWDALYSPP